MIWINFPIKFWMRVARKTGQSQLKIIKIVTSTPNTKRQTRQNTNKTKKNTHERTMPAWCIQSEPTNSNHHFVVFVGFFFVSICIKYHAIVLNAIQSDVLLHSILINSGLHSVNYAKFIFQPFQFQFRCRFWFWFQWQIGKWKIATKITMQCRPLSANECTLFH